MKRRIFIATTALAASVGFAGTAAAQTKWDFATAYPAHNFHSKNNEQFVKDVEAATQGKLKITPHFGASLFKMPEIKRAVQTGNAQMGEFFLVSFQNEAPIFGADGLPFWSAAMTMPTSSIRPRSLRCSNCWTSRGKSCCIPWPGLRKASTPKSL